MRIKLQRKIVFAIVAVISCLIGVLLSYIYISDKYGMQKWSDTTLLGMNIGTLVLTVIFTVFGVIFIIDGFKLFFSKHAREKYLLAYESKKEKFWYVVHFWFLFGKPTISHRWLKIIGIVVFLLGLYMIAYVISKWLW
jgi:hypothetical protein